MQNNITDDIIYIGVDDTTIDLFENQYIVPDGISYNSYVILDEKIAIMDAVDSRKEAKWMEQLKGALAGKSPDYLIITHMEPDHSGGVKRLSDEYPEMKIVGNAKTFTILSQFTQIDSIEERKTLVADGEELSLGRHTLKFVTAPMVHWPEVMLAYESHTKTLFSADAFGKFGVSGGDDWACEARRYYYNIVGKYGSSVQTLLKKLAGVELSAIAPLHGPILRDNFDYYIDLYDKWSRYEAEEDSILVCFASIHGHTEKAAHELVRQLKAKGKQNVEILDLVRDDMAQAVEDAFYSESLVLVAASYDGGVFPAMAHYLHRLKEKGFQRRRVGIVENGSWAPSAGRTIKAALEGMKEITILEPIVTIKSAYKPTDAEAMGALVDRLIER